MEKLKIWQDNIFESKGTEMRLISPTLSISQEFNVEPEEKQNIVIKDNR